MMIENKQINYIVSIWIHAWLHCFYMDFLYNVIIIPPFHGMIIDQTVEIKQEQQTIREIKQQQWYTKYITMPFSPRLYTDNHA